MKSPKPMLALIIFLISITSGFSQDTSYLAEYGLSSSYSRRLFGNLGDIPRMSWEVLDVFLHAREKTLNQDYQGAARIMDRLWSKYPPGTDTWHQARTGGHSFDLGYPVAYSSLRMLDVYIRYKLRNPASRAPNAQLTVILPGRTRGQRPRNMRELENGTGSIVVNYLQQGIMRDDFRQVRDMATPLLQYLEAISGGELVPRLNILYLPELELPVGHWVSSYGGSTLQWSGMNDDWYGKLLEAVPAEVNQNTDWWWIIHPSHFPTDIPEVNQIGFITGGMGGWPTGGPLFISDDRTHTERRPFNGGEPLSFEEQVTYIPQWFQHEFFHHLFGKYPDYRLEVNGHDWFDRNFWPSDFRGIFEADYFHEAMNRRILQDSSRSLAQVIRYAPGGGVDLANLNPNQIRGIYTRNPYQNGWHRGQLELISNRPQDIQFQWSNGARVSWRLNWNTRESILRTGEDNPYYRQASQEHRDFRLELTQNSNGQAQVRGFWFLGEFYQKQGSYSLSLPQAGEIVP